jgi:hypothetical protein
MARKDVRQTCVGLSKNGDFLGSSICRPPVGEAW